MNFYIWNSTLLVTKRVICITNCSISSLYTISLDEVVEGFFTNVFLQKDIILTPPTEPIWKITDVITSAEVTKLDLSGEKAFASGFAYIDINYKTLISSSSENTINGDLQYINLIIPFSTCINFMKKCMLR